MTCRMLLSFMALLLSIAVMVHATDRAVHVEGRVPEVIRASQGFNPVESAGLFVGIRHFDDSEFIDVPFAVDDAVDLAHLFVLELDLIAPQQVLLALSGEPQKPQSVQALQALRQAGAKRVEAQKSKILRHLRHQAAISHGRPYRRFDHAHSKIPDTLVNFFGENRSRSWIKRR